MACEPSTSQSEGMGAGSSKCYRKNPMGRLDGKISLILGGAGFVGEGIVRSFLEEGAFVIVPSRSQERLQGLRGVLGPLANERLVTVPAGTGTQQGAEAL